MKQQGEVGTRGTDVVARPDRGFALRSPDLVARFASLLYLGGGAATILSVLLPAAPGFHRVGVFGVGVVAIAGSGLIRVMPWERWPRWVLPTFGAGAGIVLITIHNYLGGSDPFRYGIFYLLVFIFIGATQPRWACLKYVAPATLVSYLIPLVIDDAPGWALASAFYSVPVYVLVGETLAWLAERGRGVTDELERSERRFRSIVQRSTDLIAILDDGGRFLYASPAVSRLLGYGPDELEGRSIIDFVHPEDVRHAYDAFEDVGSGAVVGPVRSRWRASDGTWRHIETVASDHRHDPGIRGWVVNSRDVTEQEEARLDLSRYTAELSRLNQELQEHDRLKDEFVSTASHELRTPLTAILGFSATMRESWERLPEGTKVRMAEGIQRQSQRLTRLVDDLLSTSRIVSGQLRVEPETLDVAAAVGEANAICGGCAEVCVPEGLRVRFDPDHFQQIVSNLITNASKYGEEPIVARAEAAGGVVEICVTDEGPGVPEEFAPHLFDKFRQGDGGGARGSGLGLGLSICRALAEANDGKMLYRRNHPRGACFALRCPAAG